MAGERAPIGEYLEGLKEGGEQIAQQKAQRLEQGLQIANKVRVQNGMRMINRNEIYIGKLDGDKLGEADRSGITLDQDVIESDSKMATAYLIAEILFHEAGHENNEVMEEALVRALTALFFPDGSQEEGHSRVREFLEIARYVPGESGYRGILVFHRLYLEGKMDELASVFEEAYVTREAVRHGEGTEVEQAVIDAAHRNFLRFFDYVARTDVDRETERVGKMVRGIDGGADDDEEKNHPWARAS